MSKGVEAIKEPIMVIKDICPEHININAIIWTPLNKQIIAGCQDGKIYVINAETGIVDKTLSVHDSDVTCLITSYDHSMFATSSKDAKAKVFDITTFEEICSFSTDRPLNGVALSPILNHLVVVGGVEARDVTTTRTQKMESLFYNIASGEEIGRVKGSFGTMNSVQFNPNGKSFITGGEDGYVRLCFFDEDYFTMDEKKEKKLMELEEIAKNKK